MNSEQMSTCMLELLSAEEKNRVSILKEVCTIGHEATADVRLTGEGHTSCTINCKEDVLYVNSGQVVCNGVSVAEKISLTYPSIITVENTSFKLTKDSLAVAPQETDAYSEREMHSDSVKEIEGEAIVENDLVVCHGKEVRTSPEEEKEKEKEEVEMEVKIEEEEEEEGLGEKMEDAEEDNEAESCSPTEESTEEDQEESTGNSSNTEEDVAKLINNVMKTAPSFTDLDIVDGCVRINSSNMEFGLFSSDEELEPEVPSEEQEEEQEEEISSSSSSKAQEESLSPPADLEPSAPRVSIFDSIPYEKNDISIPPLSTTRKSPTRSASSTFSPAMDKSTSLPASKNTSPSIEKKDSAEPMTDTNNSIPAKDETEKHSIETEYPESCPEYFEVPLQEEESAPVMETEPVPVTETAPVPVSEPVSEPEMEMEMVIDERVEETVPVTETAPVPVPVMEPVPITETEPVTEPVLEPEMEMMQKEETFTGMCTEQVSEMDIDERVDETVGVQIDEKVDVQVDESVPEQVIDETVGVQIDDKQVDETVDMQVDESVPEQVDETVGETVIDKMFRKKNSKRALDKKGVSEKDSGISIGGTNASNPTMVLEEEEAQLPTRKIRKASVSYQISEAKRKTAEATKKPAKRAKRPRKK
ncbi:hypothetical protein NECID01_0417 [Nematocida sp. AWRm77]|nr:hypothetical protein NECID01_0417 [Nematocida sp. AWRm77]